MEDRQNMDMQTVVANDTGTKTPWIAPVVAKVQAGDAEAGANTSEGGIAGS